MRMSKQILGRIKRKTKEEGLYYQKLIQAFYIHMLTLYSLKNEIF